MATDKLRGEAAEQSEPAAFILDLQSDTGRKWTCVAEALGLWCFVLVD